jgi:hypothetical protein
MEDFHDCADELMQQLEYGGYDLGEYVSLTDRHYPTASCCGE